MASTLRIWHTRDRGLIRRTLDGLNALDKPSRPTATDGIPQHVRWMEAHPPTTVEYRKLLDRAVGDGVLTIEDRATLATVTPIEGVAALRARMAVAAQGRTQ
ncbi:hypothetical protein [Micromonospora sp. NPDC048169]|uniref:hypothetical protein n=1 Tax=Micromonospora sp. NPDC048169 TaxID=3154711 RepID=UPI0034080AFE